MKFKFRLDESLFDEVTSDVDKSPSLDIDDDFSAYEDTHNIEDVLPGPAQGADQGVATELIALINDEWEAIQGYNNAIATLRSVVSSNPFYEDAINVLEEISSEENTHVGQLQEVLKQISPNTAEIKKGEVEAKSQLGLVDGVLPVQSWNTPVEAQSTVTNKVDDTCMLSDIDDEM